MKTIELVRTHYFISASVEQWISHWILSPHVVRSSPASIGYFFLFFPSAIYFLRFCLFVIILVHNANVNVTKNRKC